MKKKLIYSPVFVCLLVFNFGSYTFAQNNLNQDQKADQYFETKDFAKSIAIWLNILDADPDNERIQRKVEIVYEIKYQKDIELENALLAYKISRKRLKRDELEEGVKKGEEAWNSYKNAYRLDPKDDVIQSLKEEMLLFIKEINAAKKKLELSARLKRRYQKLKLTAETAMKEEKFEKALADWKEILSFFPDDPAALEGRRKAQLAISNRLKFEKIKRFLASGVLLFNNKEYKKARLEFIQVLNIDPKNRDAKDYIDDIDDKLEEKRLYKERVLQAEDYYKSGNENLRNGRFDLAEEDFERTIALIGNYKDAEQKLKNISKYKAEYVKRQQARKRLEIEKQFQEGMRSLSDARYKDAIAAFGKTLLLDPENNLAKKYLSQAKDAQKNVEEEVVDINSPYYDIVSSLIRSGKQLFSQGKYNLSLQRWERIIELFPKNRIANSYRFRCYIKLRPGTAAAVLKKTYSEGQTLIKKRKYREALKKFELVESIDPDYLNVKKLITQTKNRSRVRTIAVTPDVSKEINRRYRLALNYFKRGGKQNLQNALAELNWILKRDPNNVKAAISYNKISNSLRPIAVSGPKISPEKRRQAQRHYYRGINYYTNNSFRKAIEEWQKALRFDPNHVQARNNINKTRQLLLR